MMKLASRVVLLVMVAVGVLAGTASAQKIAVIDSRTVLASLPEAQAAQQKLEGLRKTWTDSLQMMRTAYQAKADTYAKVGDNGSADFKKKAADDLAGLENQYAKFQNDKFGQEGELATMQQQMMAPIFDKVKTALDAYAKKEKYTMILDKAQALFVEPAIDVTSKFQDYIKSAK